MAIALRAPLETLPLRIVPAAPLDDDALYELCSLNADLRIERLPNGDLVVMAPTGAETGRRNFEIGRQLGAWAVQDGTGLGLDSSAGFLLADGSERSPDAAWILRDRWDAVPAAQRERFLPLCPDFVIELRSPSDRLPDLVSKMAAWIANGARLAWLVDPVAREVRVYRPGREETVEPGSSVSADPELPGFALDLSSVW